MPSHTIIVWFALLRLAKYPPGYHGQREGDLTQRGVARKN
jgi:hypothetical protein